MDSSDHETEMASAAERRKFLATCGKFAVVTPPTITLLLSTSLTSNAVTNSGGKNGNNGRGNGGNDGSPNGRPDVRQ